METREKINSLLLPDQTSPCSGLKEKFKCIEYIGKVEKWAETSPKNQKNFLIQISSLNPGSLTK